MGLFNYEVAKRKYSKNEDMLETVRRLSDFDEFHCLRKSNLLLAGEAGKHLLHANEEYISWMTVCNGGLLFDTTLLSITGEDTELGIEFSTLEEYNNEESYQEFGLPKGYYIIALRNYGDPICLSDNDSKVYLWDCEEEEFTIIWEGFFDFLSDEVDSAIELIANDDLEPIPLKLVGEDE